MMFEVIVGIFERAVVLQILEQELRIHPNHWTTDNAAYSQLVIRPRMVANPEINTTKWYLRGDIPERDWKLHQVDFNSNEDRDVFVKNLEKTIEWIKES